MVRDDEILTEEQMDNILEGVPEFQVICTPILRLEC